MFLDFINTLIILTIILLKRKLFLCFFLILILQYGMYTQHIQIKYMDFFF